VAFEVANKRACGTFEEGLLESYLEWVAQPPLASLWTNQPSICESRATLVVVPASILDQWKNEVEKWDPALACIMYAGGGSGSGGSRPGFGGRMPKLPTLVSKQDFKVRAKEEVDTYRAVAGKQYMDGLILVDSNPLVWWKTYAATFPYLTEVSRRYLAIPATSAPVERLFSVAGQVVTATRNRLHPETVTLLVFLHEDLPLHRDMKFQSFLDTMSTEGDVELVGD
jgi:hypothetical protein